MKAGGATVQTFTLMAAGWATEDGLATQTLTLPNMKVSDILSPGIPEGLTLAQVKAISRALLVLRSQNAGSVKVSCLGKTPVIDLPFAVVNFGGGASS
jgi:hypothetical protein